MVCLSSYERRYGDIFIIISSDRVFRVVQFDHDPGSVPVTVAARYGSQISLLTCAYLHNGHTVSYRAISSAKTQYKVLVYLTSPLFL